MTTLYFIALPPILLLVLYLPDIPPVLSQQVEESGWLWRAKAIANKRTAARPFSSAGRSLLDKEKYSCKRQRLDFYCNDKEHRVRRQAQFVLRWYFDAREDKCVSYPWGYCAGDPVASDSTLRTKEECDILCTPPQTEDIPASTNTFLSALPNIPPHAVQTSVPTLTTTRRTIPAQVATHGQPIAQVIQRPAFLDHKV